MFPRATEIRERVNKWDSIKLRAGFFEMISARRERVYCHMRTLTVRFAGFFTKGTSKASKNPAWGKRVKLGHLFYPEASLFSGGVVTEGLCAGSG